MNSRLTTCLLMFIGLPCWAAKPFLELEIKHHLFYPTEIVIPANTKVQFSIFNRDSTPEKFESYELNLEKIIMGGSEVIIFIGPLAPGIYPFFGEFNPKTARGRVVVK